MHSVGRTHYAQKNTCRTVAKRAKTLGKLRNMCAYHAQSFTCDGLPIVIGTRLVSIFWTNIHVQVFDFEHFGGGEGRHFPFFILVCLLVR